MNVTSLEIVGAKPIDRRTMLKRSSVAVGGFAIGSAFTSPACPPKNISIYVRTVIGVMAELKPLLPNSAQFIAKAIKIAEDFDEAYRAGKFDNAIALFENLAGVISQIAADAGVDNPTVKIALAVAGVAMRAIAVLLKSQSDEPAVAAAINERKARSAAVQRQVSLVERLANSAAIDKLFLDMKIAPAN